MSPLSPSALKCPIRRPNIILIVAAVITWLTPLAQAQVLTQVSKDLGNGFRSQESKQVNVPGRWQSNQSFKFLYFEKRHLCQCSEFSIAPSGQLALFQDAANRAIGSFNVKKNHITIYPNLPNGKLLKVTWLTKERQAEVQLLVSTDNKEVLIKKRLTLK